MFCIYDKTTGAIMGQQPFGGSGAFDTNEKTGSYLNPIHWIPARALKNLAAGEALPYDRTPRGIRSPLRFKNDVTPPRDFRYLLMSEASSISYDGEA